MRHFLLFLFLLTIPVALAISSSSGLNFLAREEADNYYATLGADAYFNNLSVNYFSAYNKSVINVTDSICIAGICYTNFSDSFVNRNGDTMTGDLSLDSNELKNVSKISFPAEHYIDGQYPGEIYTNAGLFNFDDGVQINGPGSTIYSQYYYTILGGADNGLELLDGEVNLQNSFLDLNGQYLTDNIGDITIKAVEDTGATSLLYQDSNGDNKFSVNSDGHTEITMLPILDTDETVKSAFTVSGNMPVTSGSVDTFLTIENQGNACTDSTYCNETHIAILSKIDSLDPEQPFDRRYIKFGAINPNNNRAMDWLVGANAEHVFIFYDSLAQRHRMRMYHNGDTYLNSGEPTGSIIFNKKTDGEYGTGGFEVYNGNLSRVFAVTSEDVGKTYETVLGERGNVTIHNDTYIDNLKIEKLNMSDINWIADETILSTGDEGTVSFSVTAGGDMEVDEIRAEKLDMTEKNWISTEHLLSVGDNGVEKFYVTAGGEVTAQGTLTIDQLDLTVLNTISTYPRLLIGDNGANNLNITSNGDLEGDGTNDIFNWDSINMYETNVNTYRERIAIGDNGIKNIRMNANGDIHTNGMINVTKNISMKSPDGNTWNCGVDNSGTFSCS